jgi:transcriptional regulator with XRE-family HTH domain
MITLEVIRKNLIAAIKNSGFKQSELAKKLNIRQQSVQQYLSGKTMPALDTFANLCKVLDVDPKEILDLED